MDPLHLGHPVALGQTNEEPGCAFAGALLARHFDGRFPGGLDGLSKWGIIGLMKSPALELGPYKITINALIPCLIDTPLTRHEERYAQVLQDAGKRPAGSPTDEEEARKILTTKTPLGVWIDPADVAPVVVFLASDAARMVSGATYHVTAGDSARNTA